MSKHTIIDDLLATLPNKPVPVRSVHVGAHWTAVCSTRCGLATTIIGDNCHDHKTVVRDAGSLHLKSAQELAEYAKSNYPLEASIGIAAINSLLDMDERNAVEMNASQVLMEKGAGKNVALVGHFPFIPKLRDSVKNLWVLELNPTEDDYPAQAASELIPKADIVALTASSLINHTMDNLLELCDPDALVMILGPSTPLSPVLFDRGANIVAGSRVLDENDVLHAIAQGSTFQQVTGVKLLTFTHP
ncbi:DUF364 domain-containing protein [uncultured Methanocorpusculum sp.]|nr:DUF364 domain-containing protein [uncultured Methanocorpusculum sp.]